MSGAQQGWHQPRGVNPLSTAASHPRRGSLGRQAAGRAGKVLLGHMCSFMAPKGTFLIISPRNLINLHSVMNLEISIKNIITNQDRIESSQGLLIALQWQEVWVCVLASLHFGNRPMVVCLSSGAGKPRHGEAQLELPFYRKPGASKINPKKGESPKKPAEQINK